MGFKIKPFHGLHIWTPQYAGHEDIHAWLKQISQRYGETFHWVKSRLPNDLGGEYGPVLLIDGRTTVLRVDPGRQGQDRRNKSSKHRVFAVCPDCKAEVPAGRTVQHKCK